VASVNLGLLLLVWPGFAIFFRRGVFPLHEIPSETPTNEADETGGAVSAYLHLGLETPRTTSNVLLTQISWN
jgi:hypothetical protein